MYVFKRAFGCCVQEGKKVAWKWGNQLEVNKECHEGPWEGLGHEI